MPVAVFFVLVSLYETKGPNSDGSKIAEIENLWSTLPLYSGMTEVNNSRSSSGRKAHLSRSFKSDSPYEEMRRLYVGKLIEQGWQFVKERQLSDWGRDKGGRELEFRRGEYQLSIEYAGGSPDQDWNYAIGIYWYDE